MPAPMGKKRMDLSLGVYTILFPWSRVGALLLAVSATVELWSATVGVYMASTPPAALKIHSQTAPESLPHTLPIHTTANHLNL